MSATSHAVVVHANSVIHHVHVVWLPWLCIELILDIDSTIEVLNSVLIELLSDLRSNHLLNLLEI